MLDLPERFKTQYAKLDTMNLSNLKELYSPDVIFKDPVHKLRGLVAVEDYMASLCENISEGQFEYLDQLVSDHTAYIKWDMHYRHPRLGNELITVRGVSQIQFDSHIYYHEDSYDMGSLLYDHLPILGTTTRWLKRRLVAG